MARLGSGPGLIRVGAGVRGGGGGTARRRRAPAFGAGVIFFHTPLFTFYGELLRNYTGVAREFGGDG
jgi:hypothetical protein